MPDVFPSSCITMKGGLFSSTFERGVSASRAANEHGDGFLVITETEENDFNNGQVFIPDCFKPLLRHLLRKAELLM